MECGFKMYLLLNNTFMACSPFYGFYSSFGPTSTKVFFNDHQISRVDGGWSGLHCNFDGEVKMQLVLELATLRGLYVTPHCSQRLEADKV